MGSQCHYGKKQLHLSKDSNSTFNTKIEKKKTTSPLPNQNKSEFFPSTSSPIQATTQVPPPISIQAPPNLFLAVTMTNSKKDKFLKGKESVPTIANRLINNEFNEFLLKEKNITKILDELTNLPQETINLLNNELITQFKIEYFEHLKSQNEKIHEILFNLFSLFLPMKNTTSSNQKFEDFNKSFICFLITIHHIFKNSLNLSNLHQSYYHKDCSRPVSNDKMFLEEKTFIYMKDLNQMPYCTIKSLVNNIVDKALKDSIFNDNFFITMRDETFVDTWDKEHAKIFGIEGDHVAIHTKNYMLLSKGFLENCKSAH